MENEETTPLILSDWVEIQSAFSSDESRGYENENPVVINEYFFDGSAVFPASNHEDLPIDPLTQVHQIEEEQSQVFLSSSSGGHGVVEDGVEKEAGRWIRKDALTLRFFTSAIGNFFSGMTKCAAFRPSVWWFGTATTGVGALALVVVLSLRAKRWQKKVPQPAADRNHHLMLMIQSKDQKISQLLLQVSQLNEMLLARRRVPVLQIG